MIVEGLLHLIYWLLSLLLAPITIESLPEGVSDAVSWATTYISQGLSILAAFTHLGYLLTLFSFVIIIDISMILYKFIRWLLRKIPMVEID